MNGLLERLTYPLDPDAFRLLLGPLRTQRLQGVIESVTPLTPTSAELVLRVGRSWPGHLAGQFVTIGVDINGVRHTRCYSLTSAAAASSADRISIAVQAKPDGFVSKHLVHRTLPGTTVQLGAPDGEFTLESAASRRILFLTGGSGVTPAVGMLRTLATMNAASRVSSSPWDVVAVHHAPTRDQAMFADELEALGRQHPWLTVALRTTRESGHGHLDADVLGEVCPDWADRDVFACGPSGLIDFASNRWTEAGAAHRVHVEHFAPPIAGPGSSQTGLNEGAQAQVTFSASQHQVTAEAGSSLLETAESTGLLPQSGCRMGICRTCTVPLVQGTVVDMRNGRRSDAGSHVQICVSAPVGDVTIGA